MIFFFILKKSLGKKETLHHPRSYASSHLLFQTKGWLNPETIAKIEYRPKEQSGEESSAMKKFKIDPQMDRDDSSSSDDEIQENSDSSSDDSDEEEELMRELARMKEQRAAEQIKKEEEPEIPQDSNPLVKKENSLVKKKWYDDSVFKRQALVEDKSEPSRFINDPLRNDFHRKFMRKNIR